MRWVKKFTLSSGVLLLSLMTGCALFSKDPGSELALEETAAASQDLSQAPDAAQPEAPAETPPPEPAIEPVAEAEVAPVVVAEAEPLVEPAPPPPPEPEVAPAPDPTPAPEPVSPQDPGSPAIEKRAPAAAEGPVGKYAVKPGDTLMKIAYQTYGDLTQWKRIFDRNRSKLKMGSQLAAGMELDIEMPEVAVQIDQNGNPYLIRQGDTLGSISGEVYRTPTKWRKIYENNRQLIKDPDRIFAGFTLYYLPEPGLASLQLPAQ